MAAIFPAYPFSSLGTEHKGFQRGFSMIPYFADFGVTCLCSTSIVMVRCSCVCGKVWYRDTIKNWRFEGTDGARKACCNYNWGDFFNFGDRLSGPSPVLGLARDDTCSRQSAAASSRSCPHARQFSRNNAFIVSTAYESTTKPRVSIDV